MRLLHATEELDRRAAELKLAATRQAQTEQAAERVWRERLALVETEAAQARADADAVRDAELKASALERDARREVACRPLCGN